MSDPVTLPIRAYLRMRAGTCVAADTTRGIALVLRDTGGLFPDGITVQWLGKEAAEFYDRHQHELTAGRCLDLELFHFRSVQNQLRASVKTCQLAPLAPSWIKHADKSISTPSTPGLRLV
ncbi:hypothetical protein [Polaromonas naphthalenivorans]|uniref:Uncharacterized protein n=1 Tax=Polaromonas naphthalenivorans (strain CJ2) TaxID=365044 RepID=A1VPK2_POLNA|nr:hypothetical protein [Polaromonas naphthalenivorans]ABM37580.1 hypothetical protein Pnap_2272 [Polaromonas naphthalenivorans CJ2]